MLPRGNLLYLVHLNWLEMHLKLPRAMKFASLYSLRMTQISKAEAIMA